MATESQFKYADIQEAVAEFAGWPAVASWTARDTSQFNQILKRAEPRFYYPTLPDGQSHTWTFLKPTVSIVTSAEQREYELPADLDHIEGDLTYSSDDSDFYLPVQLTSETRIRALERTIDTTAYPEWAATRVAEPSDGSERQKQTLILHPTPDAEYKLSFRYVAIPCPISSTNPYHLGGPVHTRTYMLAFLAEAEQMLDDDGKGNNRAAFLEALQASVAFDKKRGPELIGYNGDASTSQFGRSQLRDGYIYGEQPTYNGVLY